MRDSVGLLASLPIVGFVFGQVSAWLLYRRSSRRLAERLQARAEHRISEAERQSAIRYDGLVQDILGLGLSLQAVLEQLPSNEPGRRGLERVLARMDELLSARRGPSTTADG